MGNQIPFIILQKNNKTIGNECKTKNAKGDIEIKISGLKGVKN